MVATGQYVVPCDTQDTIAFNFGYVILTASLKYEIQYRRHTGARTSFCNRRTTSSGPRPEIRTFALLGLEQILLARMASTGS